MRLPFVVNSSDHHVCEPPDLWTKRIDKKWLGREPRVVHLDDTDIWMVDDVRMAVVGIQDQAGLRFDENGNPLANAGAGISKKARIDDLLHGALGWTPELYLEGMDQDGIWAGLIYPSNTGQAFRCVDGELLDVLARTYNDWIVDEFCAAAPGRLRPVVAFNPDNVPGSIEMAQHFAKKRVGAFLLPVWPTYPKSYDMPEYQPLWDCFAELGIPIVMHLGANKRAFHHEPALDIVVHTTKDIHVQRSIASIVMGGIFGRHPGLKVQASEFGASWIAPVMGQLDRLAEEYADELEFKWPEGERPSDHVRRNVSLSFQDDVVSVQWRDLIGVENLMWGSDYPHAESTFPFSHDYLHRHLEGVSDDDAAAIAGRNAAKMFGFPAPEPGWFERISQQGTVAQL
jgi:predicted TIM-barrel fold metal-dependent hydrolase